MSPLRTVSQDPVSFAPLREIRRSFHTLFASGAHSRWRRLFAAYPTYFALKNKRAEQKMRKRLRKHHRHGRDGYGHA